MDTSPGWYQWQCLLHFSVDIVTIIINYLNSFIPLDNVIQIWRYLGCILLYPEIRRHCRSVERVVSELPEGSCGLLRR